jgi:hypothetical protein
MLNKIENWFIKYALMGIKILMIRAFYIQLNSKYYNNIFFTF